MSFNKYARYSHVGVMFITIFGICFYAGHYCDKVLKTQPLFTLLGFAAGFAIALWRLVKEVK